MKNFLKARLFQISIVSLIIFKSVIWTSDVHALDSFWNTLRSAILLISGVVFLFCIARFIYKYLFFRLKKQIKILIAIIFTPIFGFACFLIFGLSMYRFQNPKKGFPQHQAKIRNTRVFIDLIGHQGALGFLAMGVYQEGPFIGFEKFLKTVVVCENEDKYAEIDFRVVDDHYIECIHQSGRKEKIKLPL